MKFKISKKIVKLKFKDSRHAQLSIYTVFHEESEFQVKKLKFKGSRRAQLSIYTVFHEESEFPVKSLEIPMPRGQKCYFLFLGQITGF